MKNFLTRRLIIAVVMLALLALGGYFLFFYAKNHKEEFTVESLALFQKVSQLLPIAPDTKKEISVVNNLVSTFTKTDGITYTFLILLQNNFELRPGGGFLGQYGILKIQDGKIISFTVEDANLLDQRITAKVTPPWPLTRYSQIKKWKFRDSNFSPDFPTNVSKAEYFYRLGGGLVKFDGAIAVNADVLNHILAITGPITIPGFGTYTSSNAALDLEEDVEKAYLGDNVPAEIKQARKNVMKQLAAQIVSHVSNLSDFQKLANLALDELRSKNVQLSFKDTNLQAQIESVHWGGEVVKDWNKDYLFVVDANLGALKSDYYVKRSLEYTIDFTGEKPKATLVYTYNHTATHGDWRTSDYHTYTRVYTPLGSKYIDQSRVKTGGVGAQNDTTFGKTVFGYKVDALIGSTLPTSISYELPDTITPDNYELLIQKQSGIGTIPITVTVKTKDGDFTQKTDLMKDLRLTFTTTEEKK